MGLLVSSQIPNLVNGISQQPPKLRFSSQAELQENGFSSITEGLGKRPPTEHISKILSGDIGKVRVHTINRDKNERYKVLCYNNDIKVYDLLGNAKTIAAPNGKDYITNASPDDNFRLVTMSDYTFIINKTIKTVMLPVLSLDSGRKALIFINAGNYSTDYKVYIDGVEKASKTTSASDPADIKTTKIAADLVTSLTANLGGDYTITRVGCTILLERAKLDIATSVNAISSGDYSTYTKGRAYDNSETTEWISALSGDAIVNAASIGQQNTVKQIKKIRFKNSTQAHSVTRIKVKISTDLVSWVTLQALDVVDTSYLWNEFTVDNYDVSVYPHITIVAQSATKDKGRWYVQEVEMWDDDPNFRIRAEDSNGGNNLSAFRNEVQKFSSLPTVAPNGFQIKILGNEADNTDDYYVKFKTQDNSSFGSGGWIEDVAPNIKYKIDASTMPHVLIRESDGTFTFREGTWGDRVAGDEVSSKDPSFIGNTINEMFTFKNRLGILSGENRILSRVDDIFSFFCTTVLTKLDTDPIDSSSASGKVSVLNFVAPYNEALILFSNDTQYISGSGDGLLTYKTDTIKPSTFYDCSDRVRPASSANNIFFVSENNKWASVREYFVNQNLINEAKDITAHVSSYIPVGVFKMAVSSNSELNLVCLLTEGDPSAIYNYKYYYNDNDKIQAAWSRWTLKDAKILDIEFITNILSITAQYPDGVYLMEIDFTAKKKDINIVTPAFSYAYLAGLDRKSYNPISSYNAETDKTTFSLPFTNYGTLIVLDERGNSIVITDQTSTSVAIKGDYRERDVIIGNTYEFRYRFSTIYRRLQTSSGDLTISEGRLQIRKMGIDYTNTSHFRAEVTPYCRAMSKAIFTGRITGTPSAKLGVIPISDGKFDFSVNSKNDQVIIDLVNDTHLPSYFQSAIWEGFFNIRSKSI